MLLVFEAVGRQLHLQTRGGKCAIRSNDEIGLHRCLPLVRPCSKARDGAVEIKACAALVEMNGHGTLFGQRHHFTVEQAAAGSVNGLTLPP